MKKAILAARQVTMIGLLLLGAGAAAASDGEEELVREASWEVSAGGTLTVDVHDADVELTSGGAQGVDAKVYLRGRDLERARSIFESMDFTLDGDRNGVTITSERPSIRRTWLGGNYGVRVEVRVPESWSAEVKTGDGDVAIERLSGEVRVHTGDGDVHLGGADSPRIEISTGDGDVVIGEALAPEVSLRTGDGDVTVSALYGRSHRVRTGDGDVHVKELEGDLVASTGDGDLRVSLAIASELELRSGDGDITISLPAGSGAEVELSGSDVSVRGADFDGEKQRRRMSGTVGGGGPRVQASSGDGSVTVRVGG